MTLSKKELEGLADRHQQKADKAFMVYQETGTQRYYREYEKNSDYAEAFLAAADAAEDRVKLGYMKADLGTLAANADEVLGNGADIDELKAFVERVVSVAVSYGVYARRERMQKEGEKDA